MGVNPTSIAELYFPEVIIDTALFSSRTSSFVRYWRKPLKLTKTHKSEQCNSATQKSEQCSSAKKDTTEWLAF